jgi:protein-glucosylgalactosylhydroxylysine glucosidase
MQKQILLQLLLLIFSSSVAQKTDPWKISATTIDPSHYYGVTVANGMMGIVSSPEPLQVKEVVLAGAYDLYGRGRVSNFLRSFNLLHLSLEVDGQAVSISGITNFSQELDMRRALFTGSFDIPGKASVSYSYCALRQLPYGVLMNISISAKSAISITAASIMEATDALKEVQNYFNELDRPAGSIQLLTSTAKSPTGRLQLCASTAFIFNEANGQQPKVSHSLRDNNMHSMRFTKKIGAGTTYSFSIAGTSITSAHHQDPLNEAERLTIYAVLEGSERLMKFHQAAWDQLWKSDITIEGDLQAQQDVHSMLYHLYSFVREGTAQAPSPMGLSGLGYNGHIFWDSELWMFPPLLLLQPQLARSMMEYRFQRLEAAKQNAFAYGYRGAMFPWESAASGEEDTPVWALSGPFEHHITADVAIAAWNYYCITKDKQWLKEKGFPILSATADFWTSRVERNGPGKYEIRNVVAADEWAENVDNNAFTNASAKANLRFADAAASILGLPRNPDWMLVADNIPVLKMDDGVTREHASYAGEGIKQADVNLLAYPLKEITDNRQIRKDLEYYETRVPNKGTPAMTQAVFALLYARLGDAEKAAYWFRDAYLPNLLPPFRVIAETKGGTNPYFATGAGGVLQAVLMGFAGIDITPGGMMQIKSVLPAGWKKLTVTGLGPEKKTVVINAGN